MKMLKGYFQKFSKGSSDPYEEDETQTLTLEEIREQESSDEDDVHTAANFLIDHDVINPSQKTFKLGIFYTSSAEHFDQTSDDEIFFSYHLKGFSPAEEKQVFQLVKKAGVAMKNPAKKKTIKVYFQTITEESASQGDYAETGEHDEVEIKADEYDLEDGKDDAFLAAEYIKDQGSVEPSDTSGGSGTWYTTIDPERDYEYGEETYYTFHLKGFSPVEEEKVFDLIMGKKKKNPSSKVFGGKKKGNPSADEDDEFEPDEDDIFFSSSGPLGARTSLSAGGKFIGEFSEFEDAEIAAANWCEKNNFYPNAWIVSDHGNYHLTQLAIGGSKRKDVSSALEEVFGGKKKRNPSLKGREFWLDFDGREVLIEDVKHILKVSSYKAKYPREEYVISVYAEPKLKNTVYYQEAKKLLGDDWSVNVLDSPEVEAEVLAQLLRG